MKALLKKMFRSMGYDLERRDKKMELDGIPLDMNDPGFLELYRQCDPYSFTGITAQYTLYNTLNYVISNRIPGDLVECGVWRGGSAMMMALVLKRAGITDRKIWLYDTFEGMSAPTPADEDIKGNAAAKLMGEQEQKAGKNVWCYSTLEEVKQNMGRTGYPTENIILVKGKVEDTLPGTLPAAISLLRLDTDFYESTYHELKHLYPLLVKQGVLIVDDYGHWKGARKAVDQYIAEQRLPLLLQRIDYTVRAAIKI